jgi:hypothetical protein
MRISSFHLPPWRGSMEPSALRVQPPFQRSWFSQSLG